jgi:hypothetical protein
LISPRSRTTKSNFDAFLGLGTITNVHAGVTFDLDHPEDAVADASAGHFPWRLLFPMTTFRDGPGAMLLVSVATAS